MNILVTVLEYFDINKWSRNYSKILIEFGIGFRYFWISLKPLFCILLILKSVLYALLQVFPNNLHYFDCINKLMMSLLFWVKTLGQDNQILCFFSTILTSRYRWTNLVKICGTDIFDLIKTYLKKRKLSCKDLAKILRTRCSIRDIPCIWDFLYVLLREERK